MEKIQDLEFVHASLNAFNESAYLIFINIVNVLSCL